MRTVYAVSQGSYSDYRVRLLFENKEDAEAHVAAIRASDEHLYDEPEVEEFGLMAPGELPEQVIIYRHAGTVWPDGTLGNEREWDSPEWNVGDYYAAPQTERPHGRTWSAPAWGEGLRVQVEGRSKDTVDKAFHDRVAQAKAQLLGVTG